MKKLVIGVVVFTIVSVLITWGLIRVKNNGTVPNHNEEISSDVSGDKNENQEVNNDTSSTNREKTLDLYGTYDENDLVIEEVVEKFELSNVSVELKIPKIKGLKDKIIEEKVNNDIKNRIIEKVNEISKENNFSVVSSRTETTYECGSFSNVISYTWRISYKLANESKSESIYLNYELVNGERLKFEDLFAKDTDLHSIVRRMIYRHAVQNTISYDEMVSEVYYDKENGKWMYNGWDYETGEDIIKEYIPRITEDDISKEISAFMNTKEKKFYFTPTTINIVSDRNAYSYYLYFKDIADDVVIYDKYLTEESLYETSDIGVKNLWTCSEPTFRTLYINYGFLEENLYYDINMNDIYYIKNSDYPFHISLTKMQNKLFEESKEKIEEYRKIAKENPDKFYVLGISSYCDVNSDDNEYNILISTRINEYLTTTDISYKEDVMNELLASYRYHNLGFYNSALEHAGYTYNRSENEYYNGDIVFDSFEHKVYSKTYDARNLKEITSIDEIFKNSDAHRIIVTENLKLILRNKKPELSTEELDKLIEKTVFVLQTYGISAIVPGFNYEIWIMNYKDFNKSILNIYDLDMYIIPDSNTRKIERTEIENMNLDELNRAYNEIFARYGHDFKSKELKEYFELCSWYTPIANKSVSLEELNEIERYNLDIIKSLINEKK